MYGIDVYMPSFGSQAWSGLYRAVDQTEHFPQYSGEKTTLSVCNRDRPALKTLCVKLLSLTKTCHIKRQEKKHPGIYELSDNIRLS